VVLRITRSALLRLETESQQAEQQLRAELAQSALRLRAYESLEEEVDAAVMRTAGTVGLAGTGRDTVCCRANTVSYHKCYPKCGLSATNTTIYMCEVDHLAPICVQAERVTALPKRRRSGCCSA
jgi:hypothetical protein